MSHGADPAGQPTELPVTIDRVIDGERAEHLYRVYLACFGPLSTEAAARHVLHREEFLEEMADPRIDKFTVWRSATEPIALATVTNQPDAVAWISPGFFAARHPEQAARQAVYYLGIAMVAPGRGQYGLLERIVRELVKPCVAHRGVLAYDVCSYNERTIRFGRRAEAILQRIAPVEVRVADTQTYYQAVFT